MVAADESTPPPPTTTGPPPPPPNSVVGRHAAAQRHHIFQHHQQAAPPLGLHQAAGGYSAAPPPPQPPPRGGAAGLSLSLHHHHHQHHHPGGAMPSTSRVPPKAAAAAPPGSSPRSGGGAADGERSGHSRDDAWTENATIALIDAWGERYLQLNRGNLKQKHWREVADEVNRRVAMDENKVTCSKTDVQCKNRLDTLKKKYKIEKARLMSEGSPSKWTFFVKLEELIGPSKKGKKKVTTSPSNLGLTSSTTFLRTNQVHHPQQQQQQQQQEQQQHMRLDDTKNQHNQQQGGTSNSSSSKDSGGMTDSCENHNGNVNHGAVDGKPSSSSRKRKLEGPFKDLARAIIKFGEVYERIESAKQQQLMDLERQRMEFTKELELQRMQLFMQTQVELAKMKHAKHGNTEHYL